MFEMGSHDPFGHLKHKLWPKERLRVTKLWVPKVARDPSLGISGLPLGIPETKCHLDVGLVERHKIYYKGEGCDFPKSGPW